MKLIHNTVHGYGHLTRCRLWFCLQIDDKESELKASGKELERHQRQLDNQSRRVEGARQEIRAQYARDEKIWQAEVAAGRFRLEAETKYFREELARLQARLEGEAKERAELLAERQGALREAEERRLAAERAERECAAARQAAEKEALSVSERAPPTAEILRPIFSFSNCGLELRLRLRSYSTCLSQCHRPLQTTFCRSFIVNTRDMTGRALFVSLNFSSLRSSGSR